jgi:hypothetical protein
MVGEDVGRGVLVVVGVLLAVGVAVHVGVYVHVGGKVALGVGRIGLDVSVGRLMTVGSCTASSTVLHPTSSNKSKRTHRRVRMALFLTLCIIGGSAYSSCVTLVPEKWAEGFWLKANSHQPVAISLL